jgi:hypothetical protein
MATYDTSYAAGPQFQGHSNNRMDRPLRLSWSGIFGGTALGWAVFSLLTLIGAAIGFAKFDPYSAQPANGLGAGSGIYGILALFLSSAFGGYMAVRIAGDRRRSEALLHGGISWAFSVLIGAMLAMGAARTAAQSAAAVAAGPRAQAKAQRESNVRDRSGGPTARDRDQAATASDAAAKTSGGAAGGIFLGLIGSLVGALAGAKRSSGTAITEGLRHRKTDGTLDRPSDRGSGIVEDRPGSHA